MSRNTFRDDELHGDDYEGEDLLRNPSRDHFKEEDDDANEFAHDLREYDEPPDDFQDGDFEGDDFAGRFEV